MSYGCFSNGKVQQLMDLLTDDSAAWGDEYRHSSAIIRAEANLGRFSDVESRIAVCMIHGCGMVEVADAIHFGGGFAEAGGAALRAGAPILCDSKMVAHGITRACLPANNEVICTPDAPDAPAIAKRIGNTRSAAALDLWGNRLAGAVVAIGNAPTALLHLLELLDAGGYHRPARGFRGAAESKEALRADGRVPYLIVEGRRRGSAMAVSAVSALASDAE